MREHFTLVSKSKSSSSDAGHESSMPGLLENKPTKINEVIFLKDQQQQKNE